MKSICILIIILLVFSMIIFPNVCYQSSVTNSHYQNNDKYAFYKNQSISKVTNAPLTVPINLILYANNTNITTTKTISLGISSIVYAADFYIVLSTQGVWNLHLGVGVVTLNFTYEGISQVIEFSYNDFVNNPSDTINGESHFKQIILAYHNITLVPTSTITLNMTMNVTSYLNSEYDITYYIKSMDLFFIEQPLVNPIIIPSWQYGQISLQGIDPIIGANILNYITFLPQSTDINVTITSTAPIVVKKVEIDHASWVNLPNLTLPNKTFVLNFVTDEAPSLQPRDLVLYYYATTNLPLTITITAEVVIFTITNTIPEFNQTQSNIRFLIAIILTLIPISMLLKSRRKKLKGIKI